MKSNKQLQQLAAYNVAIWKIIPVSLYKLNIWKRLLAKLKPTENTYKHL